MAERNFENRTLYHGDNLDFLRGMNSGTVNLIATDPPFNKSRDFHATPDSLASGASFQDRWSWRDDIHDDWITRLMRDVPEVYHVITAAKRVYGDDMAAFLCWLGVRLLEMHRVLREDGSLYLHCDPTASHYLKMLLDGIFGRRHFRSEVVWRRTNAHNKTSKQYGPIHDIILFYTKSEQFTFHPGTRPYTSAYVEDRFKYEDDRGRYQTNYLTGPGARQGESGQEWRGFSPTAAGRHWAVPQSLRGFLLNRGRGMGSHDQLESLYQQGFILFPRRGTQPMYKQYIGDGVPYQDIWAYQPNTRGVLHSSDECIDEDVKYIEDEPEKTGFPTQKPLGLYSRILETSSDPGDLVLDPFCGCATTPIVAERLGRQWVGMDIWDGAHEQVLARLGKEGLAVRGRRRRGQQTLTFGDITVSTTPPKRTDSGETATLVLRTPMGREGQRYPAPRTQHGRLLVDIGPLCQGCGADYTFDPRVLEVDHINPRSQNGTDAYENLTLLCPPCNKEKRDRLTLIGLQAENRKNGHMRNEDNLRMGRASGRTSRRRR